MTMPTIRILPRLAEFACGCFMLAALAGCSVIIGNPWPTPTYSETVDENLNRIAQGGKSQNGEEILDAYALAEWDAVWGFTEGTPWRDVQAAVGGELPTAGALDDDMLILVDGETPIDIFTLEIVSFSSSGQHMSRDGSFQRAPNSTELELVELGA